MAKTITLPHNWTPRPYQQKLWRYLEGGGKRAIEIAHRRWGKDDIALHWAAVAAMQRPASYWHMLPNYSQARKAIWTAVNPHTGKRRIDEAFPQQIRAATLENEMFIRFKNGSTWQVIGSDNYDSLVGTPPAGIVFSEWARAIPASWGYLAPILIENGGWALFITTPVGRNHAKSMLDMAQTNPDSWFAGLMQSSSNASNITHSSVKTPATH
jgi:phage terminase large subunit